MNHRSLRGRRILSIAVTGLVMLAAPGAVTASAAPFPPAPDNSVEVPDPGDQLLSAEPADPAQKVSADLLAGGDGTRDAFVEFALAGAADAAAGARAQGADARASAAGQRAAVAATAEVVVSAAAAVDTGATRLFEVSNAVPGIGLRASQPALAALATRPDVVRISALVPKTTDNAGGAQLTRVLRAWQDTGATGAGVRIGIIDTGVDYTHADFGGPGTVEAFRAADAADTGPFAPTAKVVGGYDFVGDDYDADPTAADHQPVPRPDANPLDCNGHGTHVAGTAAGFGVALRTPGPRL
jgi:hypothetical protein